MDLGSSPSGLSLTLDAFTRRVAGELRVPGGGTCESLSASEALAFACGDAVLL